jgi:hypothetical protein
MMSRRLGLAATLVVLALICGATALVSVDWAIALLPLTILALFLLNSGPLVELVMSVPSGRDNDFRR